MNFPLRHVDTREVSNSNPSVRPLLKTLQEAERESPNDVAAVLALAVAFQTREQFDDAAALFARAAQLKPDNPQAYRSWAHMMIALGRIDEAVEVLQQAILIEPMSMAVARDLATLFLDSERCEEAKELFALVGRRTRDPLAMVGLCKCCLGGRSWRAAAYETASFLGPTDRGAFEALTGRALIELGRLEEAKECFQEILAHASGNVAPLLGLGDAAYTEQDFHLALRYHSEACECDPGNAGAIFGCFMDYLASGRYEDARTLFYSAREIIRRQWGHGSRYSSLAPEWDGCSLQGKTILVHGAIGLGDTIQYARLISFLKDQGGTVVFEVPTTLTSLMRTLTTVDAVVSKYDPLPRIDFECDLRELFLVCDVSPSWLGLSVPYLFPSSKTGRQWFPDDTPAFQAKVGLVWNCGRLLRQGALAKRSIPIDYLQPLTALTHIRLFSLQVGASSNDLNGKNWAAGIVNLALQIRDFMDTAAIVSHLDAIVTIDTSVAHSAGAMGKPTFVMLPYSASWRWQPRNGSCVWYPSAQLFRQKQPGNWEQVVAQVKEAILGLTRSDHARVRTA